MKTWTVEISVAVQDGFNLTEERLKTMLLNDLLYAQAEEVSAKIVKVTNEPEPFTRSHIWRTVKIVNRKSSFFGMEGEIHSVDEPNQVVKVFLAGDSAAFAASEIRLV